MMQHFHSFPLALRRSAVLMLCVALCAGMARPIFAQPPVGNTPAQTVADPISIGYGVQTPAGDGVTAFNGEPITYTINLVNLTSAPINNISVFNPLPEDTLDRLICTPACGQSITTRSIPDPLGGVIEVTRTLAVSWSLPVLNPGAGVGVQLRLVGRVIGKMPGVSFSSSAIAIYDGGAIGSNSATVTVAAQPRNTNGARVENAPTWFSADAGGTLDMDWGDVNRDGALDLALASTIGTSVYRNNNGLLTRIWSVPQMSYGAKWADVNNDGVLELVVVGDSDDKTAQSPGRNRIYKYNTSTGNLGLMSEFTSTRQLVRVAVGDVNGDGFIDIIGSTNAIAVDCAVPLFMNDGAGKFAYDPSRCMTASATAAISLGDMNNDDKLDLALGAFPNDVSVRVNSTITSLIQGTSAIPIESGLSFLPYDFSWGDFDNDGYLDLAMAFPLDRQARVYHNSAGPGGTRLFTLQQILPNLNFLTPFAIDWADIDGDGALDLTVSGSPALVYVRNAAGRFVLKADLGANIGGGQVWDARAAQTQADQGLNLLFTNRDSASTMFDVIAPRLTPEIDAVFGTDVLPASHLVLADIDNNGFLDMIQGADGANVRTRAYLNIDTTFPGFSTFNTLLGPQHIAAGDFNNDGVLEIAIGDRTQLGLYTNNGTLIRNMSVPATGPYVPAWGDVNDDGLLDLWVATNGPTFIYLNTAGSLGNAPVFQTSETCTVTSTTESSRRSLAVMDVTGDRYMDFVLGCFGQPTRLYRNNQNNTFTLIWIAPASTPATDVELDDFNADGWPDLAIANDGQPIQVYENTGGNFAGDPIWNSGANNRTMEVAWGDWDNDGYPELAAANLNSTAEVYANLASQPGRPQLQRLWRTNLSAGFTSVAWGDMDQDGDLDLVSTGISSSATGLFVNTNNHPYQINTPGEPVQQVDLPRVTAYVSLERPGKTPDAFFNSTSEFLTNPAVGTVPVTFTVYGPDGSRNNNPAATVPVQGLVYEYSVDGGSTWETATPLSTTTPITQVTRAGTSGVFLWNARADQAISDNAHFRVRVIAKAPDGPVQRATAAAITPPFRLRSTTCYWADSAAMVYTPTLPIEKQTIAFAGGQVGGSGQITFSWNFGDGATRIGQLTTHSYTVAGTYNVSLTVIGPACPITRPLTINMPVTVTAGPPVYRLYMPNISNDTATLRTAMKQSAPAVDLSQQVTGLSGAMTGERLTLSWWPPASAQPDAYRIYRSTADAGRLLMGEVLPSQRAFVDETAPCGAAYDVTWVSDARGGAESLPSTTSFYTDPCVVAAKQSAQPASATRFRMTRTPSSPASPAAVLNAPASLSPMAMIVTPTIKTCDLLTGTVPNPRPSLISISSQPALSANGGLVAFWSTGNLDPRGYNADGSIELYVAGPITGTTPITMTQVTSSSGSILGGFNLWPSVNNDGTQIAFSSDRDLTGQNPESNFEVFIAQLGPNRGVTLTQISSTPAGVSLVPSLSADGNHVAFVSDGNYAGQNSQRALQVFIATLSNAQPVSYVQVTQSPALLLNDLPSISNDGQRVAFVQREFSEVSDVVSQTVMAWRGDIGASDFVTVDVTATDPRPALSGNGRYVAYVHADALEGPYILQVFDLNNPNLPPQNMALVVRECKPFISSDGNRVGCIDDPNLNIFVYNPNRNVVTLGPVVGSNAQPTLSSAGEIVAYVDTNDQIAWVTCRSADLAFVLPVTNSTPTRAGTVVTMSVPVSNLGPSASPTTTLYYTFTSTNDESIFVAGKLPSTIVTGSINYAGVFPASSVYTFTVPLSTTEFTQINMDWRVEGSADDVNPSNNFTTSSVIMQADVRFNIALAVSSEPTQNVRAGDPITYSIVLTNIGVSRATGVRITDTLPVEVSFVDVVSATSPAREMICTVPQTDTLGSVLGCLVSGTFPSQATVALTLTARVTDTALGPLSNVVSATAIELIGVASKTLTTTVLPQVDLQMSTTVSPVQPVAGSVSTFTLIITNAGRVGVPVVITSTLPDDAEYLPQPLSGWSGPDANNQITAIGFLPPLQSDSISFAVFVTETMPIDTKLVFTSYVTSTQLAGANPIGFDPMIENNTDVFTATVSRVSDFSVSLEASPSVIAGQPITYVVVYTNAGPSNADPVTVTVSAPLLEPTETQEITAVSLNAGMTGTAEFTATVGGAYITSVLTSTAFITSVNIDNNLANNAFSVASEVTSSADISAEITSAPTSVIAGNRITYTVAFSNPGPSDAVNFVAVFSATGPVSFTAPASWTKVSDTQISLTLASLAANAAPAFTITGTVPSFAPPGSFINTRLSAGSDTPDPNLSNNSDSDSALTNAEADLRVLVTPNGTAIAGLPFTFTVAYSNTGPSDAINALVVFNSQVTFPILSATAGWTISPPHVASLSIPTFAPSGPITASIVVSIPATTPAASNSVLGTISSSTTDPTPGDSSNPSFGITRSTDVSITVIAANVTDNGLAYNYTVVMTNFGPSFLPGQQFTMTWSRKLKEFTSVSSGWSSSVPNNTGGTTAATFTSILGLLPGGSSTAIVSVKMPKKGDTVTATLGVTTPGAIDPNLSNNTTNKVTSLNPVPINAITLTASGNTVISGTAATFTVTVGPDNATLPLTYTWAVANQGVIPDDVIDGDVVTNETVTRSFTWTMLGPQLVTVFANNGGAPLPASRVITVTPVNLTSVAINASATSAPAGTPYVFTATVVPANATTPITYTWNAIGQSQQQQTGGGTTSSPQSFTWTTLGTQVVTVTATNAGNTVTQTILVNVLPVNLTSVSISTPAATQLAGTPFVFTATVAPANTNTPITYTWSATGQTTQQQTGGGLTSAQQSFTWTTPGAQTVIVTATNAGNSVTQTISVNVLPINLTSVSINTSPASTQPAGSAFNFTANALPANASIPITYTWSATGQSNVVQTGGGLTSSPQNFTWSAPGTQFITVTASNAGNTVSASTIVTVTPIAPASVAITPPGIVISNTPASFTANVSPVNVTLPLTYTWSATNAAGTVNGSVNSASNIVNFTWPITGSQTVTVVVSNAYGNVVTGTVGVSVP